MITNSPTASIPLAAEPSAATPSAAAGIRTQIAGVGVAGLAREHGTPLYAYDAEKIRQRCRDLAAWDTVRFAQKACSNLAVLDLIRREGVVVDAVSTGEIHRALQAGYSARPDRPDRPDHGHTRASYIEDAGSGDGVAMPGVRIRRPVRSPTRAAASGFAAAMPGVCDVF